MAPRGREAEEEGEMKILWANQISGIGNAFGYSSQAVNMKQALADLGVTLCFDANSEYDLAVHIITPDKFVPIEGKTNLLFTMFESTSIPNTWVKPIQGAQVLVVPCRHNRDLFRNYYKGPLEICQLGMDERIFTFKQRTQPKPDEPFRFLWVGAPNPRKGYEIISILWQRWLAQGRMPRNCQLYFKTSGTKDHGITLYKAYKLPTGQSEFVLAEKLPARVPNLPSIVMDSRNIPTAELAELYQSAHAFVLPSLGEGWGLTLNEAMATGAPCIWTHYSGPRDFADETIGFPITKFKLIPIKTLKFVSGPGSSEVPSHLAANKEHDGWHTELECESYAAAADGPQLIRRLEQVYHGYPAALERGRKASERMHTRFKWSDCAKAFVKICEKYTVARVR